jgi:hypothetical protein
MGQLGRSGGNLRPREPRSVLRAVQPFGSIPVWSGLPDPAAGPGFPAVRDLRAARVRRGGG